MMPWRMDFTVLADLSASMFAACFMVLLIFLGAAQQRMMTSGSVGDTGTGAMLVVERSMLPPAAAVDLLREHGQGRGVGIDLFADRIEIVAASQRPVALGAGQMGRLPVLLEGRGDIRLYVFSNRLYDEVARRLENATVRELTVPRALRDAEKADEAWNAAFLRLADAGLEPAAFRRELAVLLGGGLAPRKTGAAAGGGTDAAARIFPSSLGKRAAAVLVVLMQLMGLAALALIERKRFFRPR